MDLSSISSDAVIESYRQQLADANHRIAVLSAQVGKAQAAVQTPEFLEAEQIVRQRALARQSDPEASARPAPEGLS